MKRWRHFLISILIIPFFIIYSLACVALSDFLTGYHWFLDLIFYIVFGIIWIFPTIKIINWLANKEAQ